MKKSSTLNKLFGKKNSNNNNSLYADNPPWILTQGAKKGSDPYSDAVVNSFSFLDDSGTATLKSRPGPRARPVLQFSTSNTETQGLAVPTPSIPANFPDNGYQGNGSKLNGNYRMCSSVGDLRQMNYYEDNLDEEIPAPPSVPPPPPPTMPPPPPPILPPPNESPPPSTISSPASPSPPDFIPPTPNYSTPVVQNSVAPVPPNIMSVGEQHQQMQNATKWKSETRLNSLPTDGPVGLPNRFSLNPNILYKPGQTNHYAEPHSTLPRSFKIPPPAPTRISSMQTMFQQSDNTNINNANEPPSSPVPSSFNPNVQAKLFTIAQGQKSLNDTLNKRKSMLIMEDPHSAIQSIDQIIEKAANKESTEVEQKYNSIVINQKALNPSPMVSVKNQTNAESKHPQSSTEFNKITHEVVNDSEYLSEAPPTPPPPPTSPPPPPPSMAPPCPPFVPPPPVSRAPTIPSTGSPALSPIPPALNPPVAPPAPTCIPPLPTISQKSPSLSKKSGIITPAPPLMVPPPPPPKAPPAPPPLPPPATPSNQSSQQPLLKALQAREESLKQIQRNNKIEIKPAEPPLNLKNNDDDQKNRVGKIKEELEALLSSPKKDDKKMFNLNNSRPGIEGNKKHLNVKGGENTLVNSLMLKVPLLPAKPEKEDTDTDNSEWLPKSNNKDIQIPEPDYFPLRNTKDSVPKTPPIEVKNPSVFPPPVQVPPSPPKATNISNIGNNPVTSYKAHHQRKASAGSWTFDTESSKSDTGPSVEKDNVSESEEIPSPKQTSTQSPTSPRDSVHEHPSTGEKIDAGSPMALLLAAKKRAQNGPRARSTDRSSLPKVSVTNGFVTSSFTSQHRDGNTNTFVVVPNQETRRQVSQEGSLVSLSDPSTGANRMSSDTESSQNKSSWRNFEFQTSNVGGAPPFRENEVFRGQRTQYDRVMDISVNPDILTKSDDYRSYKSELQHSQIQSTIDSPVSNNMLHQNDLLHFNISSFPSPTPAPKPIEDLEFKIIPPPAEFMNSPEPSMNDLGKQNRTSIYSDGMKSDFGMPINDFNSRTNNSLASQTTESTRDYNRYTSTDYNTGVTRDSHKSSLIKKRLYMPEPEAPRNYVRSSLGLSMPYSQMQIQSNSTMAADPRRSTAPTSRYLAQGRRVSSENLNRMAPVNDLKYKPSNPEYPVNKAATSRPQSSYQGMTFTVRPGTRQPITNSYQGGYL
ncbi:uncharacterized protein C6orf132 homolog [Pelobates fuscus]|uniref:uncharacterized protein C6orf132 homolog n=1 Tax=Pelobates fuscus TaxID=191477 RepID=UPI002FE4B500